MKKGAAHPRPLRRRHDCRLRGPGQDLIGKKLLEDYAYHQREKALVICPASLRQMWQAELQEATIPAQVLSQERLGQEQFALRGLEDADVILIDEAHNFRNRHTNRYLNLETLLAANGRRGRSGGPKGHPATATPIITTILTSTTRSTSSRATIHLLRLGPQRPHNYSRRPPRVGRRGHSAHLQSKEVVVCRTCRLSAAYPEATIGAHHLAGAPRTVRYDLEATYEGFYADIVRRIERLNSPTTTSNPTSAPKKRGTTSSWAASRPWASSKAAPR